MGGVRGEAYTQAHRVSNGLAVCRKCHIYIDDDATQARLRGWLVQHPYDPAAIPVLIYTPQGYGWWMLRNDGGYEWCDKNLNLEEDNV